ncbi:Tn3 family transposase [Streptomyces sp. 5K101]|uniref:Tn3 family transposase n=1 Tax=Streptomyces sp. 5K101 TaxID=3390037 RepID=UPI003975820F
MRRALSPPRPFPRPGSARTRYRASLGVLNLPLRPGGRGWGTDAPLRRRVTAATNKVESFNRFSQLVGFGNQGIIADNDPVEQEKAMKFNSLLTNAVIFHNALDIAEIVRQLLEEGWEIDPEDLAHISPYLTEHIKRFGEYSTHELGIEPEAYDPKLDVDFTPLRDPDLTAAGLGQAA